ncbi:hypothetical protein E1091_08540 [Micromonospora fluostatini]|uniref:Uncharacterized protein n=1 Tax=Micromonospora fluostatini TaxID=1629071 RepID=A0ABY2DKU8_9ACTN|nr:hypothetical protein E1091_08540 [Micromonospora fluostatini]
MRHTIRHLVVSTAQISGIVIALAFTMTLLFEPGEWRKLAWLTDLLPLLTTIIVLNLLLQLRRLRQQAEKK